MAETFCGISALRLLRMPPQLMAVCPMLPAPEGDPRRRRFVEHPVVKRFVQLPVHRLVDSKSAATRSNSFRDHLHASPLPSGSIIRTPLGVDITSPSATLLTLAPRLSLTHLTMLAYEMCGTFSVFSPSLRMEAALAHVTDAGVSLVTEGWERVHDVRGRPTDLWNRPPLVELEELRSFALECRGFRGGQKLVRASKLVTGCAASPLEVQGSILLGFPRALGGRGFRWLRNNERVSFTRVARTLSGQSHCYVDIYLEGKDGIVAVECQGRVAHGSMGMTGLDANRLVGIKAMGIEVLPLTSEQFVSPGRFEAACRSIETILGVRHREANEKVLNAQTRLRAELFVDWSTLGA